MNEWRRVTPDEVAEHWSPADTTLGMLQRGRGLGWLRAAADPTAGKAELLTCLRANPCWDAQVEDRSLYYASLGQRLGLTAADLAPMLDSDDDDLVGLLQSVLHELARRGDDGAVDVPEDRRAVVDATAPRAMSGDQGRPSIVEASVDALLDFGWRGPLPEALLHRFRMQLTIDEVETLRSAANDVDTARGQVALAGLAARRDPAALALAASVFQRNITGRPRAAALRYLIALDPDVTLPIARSWVDTEDDRADAAAALLGLHAEAGDLPLVREALARSWATRDMYNLCDLIDALGRLADLGPFDELVSVFEEVEYSYARRRAVAVLVTSDATFADRYGRECLWDCEATVRIAGTRIARLDVPSVRERIAELAVDPHEDRDVVDAARHRLRTGARMRP